MSSNRDCNFPAKGFSTPPAYWKSPHRLPVMPMSERKLSNFSSGCRRDLFHVVHKVPAGDSPYVKAKHVQLIEKDPGKAISLFWAAINAGDRIDSALKDMAVVMKQLNRSDEAIEAIKSFRNLCPYESQESLDNVLVELYKRSGRIEEEIEMLHRKLNSIEGGIAFGGKRTKIARSQGKKVQITVEQERSRILGNLAWAYLQHHDYGLAENFYRRALALEPDNNKQCNLAICLMHMNKIPEAKSLLQAVKASCGNKEMDESYAKSYERAFEMLTEIDSKSVLKPNRDDDVWRKQQNGSKCFSSQQVGLRNDWRKGNYFESPALQSSVSSNKLQESPIGLMGKDLHHGGVLYTQPKKVTWRIGVGDQTRGRCNGDEIKTPISKVMVGTIRNLDGELLHSTAEKSEKSISSNVLSSPCERSWSERSWTLAVRGKSTETVEPFSQPRMEREKSYDWEHGNQISDVNVSGKVESTDTVEDGKNNRLTKSSYNKSWADMVEEDEKRRLLPGEDLSPCFNNWNEEERNNENLDSNMKNHQSATEETISQRLEAIDLKDTSYSSNGSTPTRNQSARRSLCFDGKNDLNMKMKTNRLQVFRDITPSQDDSP